MRNGIFTIGRRLCSGIRLIGTLIGLVNMLKAMNLDDGPELLGLNMSVALITTFYGALMATHSLSLCQTNWKLLKRGNTIKEMIVEGVVSIKEGENPKYIQEKLLNFLEIKELEQGMRKKRRNANRGNSG